MSRVPMAAVGAIVRAQETGPGGGRRPERRALVRARADLLAAVPLFDGLSARHVRRLAGLANETRARAGQVIVQAGQPGRAFYVLLEGRAKVVRGVGASSRRVAILGPGDVFGELALLDGGPRTASVVAESDLLAVSLRRAPFRRMLRAEPDVAVRLLEKLASIVRAQSPPASE